MSKMFGYVDASADKYHGRCQGHQSDFGMLAPAEISGI